MSSNIPKIPAAYIRQLFLSKQPQTVGNLAGYTLNQQTGAPGMPGISVTNSIPVRIVNSCVMITYEFSSVYSGIANPHRAYLLIEEKAGSSMYVLCGSTQGLSGTNGIAIAANGYWEPWSVPINAFQVIGTGVVVEGVWPQQ
jgi:hypothetical protein